MLTDLQLKTMLLMRNRAGTLFSLLPKEVAYHIANMDAQETVDVFCDHVANGRVDDARAMLEETPRLIFYRGCFETAAGLVVDNLSAFEFALGDGDPDMAEMIGRFYNEFTSSPAIRAQEYAKYKPHIDAMLAQLEDASGQDGMDITPDTDEVGRYDFELLLDVIKQASNADVIAALNNNTEHESVLNDTLTAFRKHFTSKTGRGMHFDYQALLEALSIFRREYPQLRRERGVDKCYLFWRQVIGFIQRFLPAVDRMAFAQGLEYVQEPCWGEVFYRSLKFRNRMLNFRDPYYISKMSAFPDSRDDVSCEYRLGFHYACLSTVGEMTAYGWYSQHAGAINLDFIEHVERVRRHFKAKAEKLSSLLERLDSHPEPLPVKQAMGVECGIC